MKVRDAIEFFRGLVGKGDRSNLCDDQRCASVPASGPGPTSGRCPGKLDQSPFPILTEWERHVGRMMLEQVVARLGYLERGGARLPDARPDAADAQRRRGPPRGPHVGPGLQPGQHALRARRAVDRPAPPRRESTGRLPSGGSATAANTVVVVEHEEAIIRAADQVIEIGPGAGERGGRVVFQGTPGGNGAMRRKPHRRLPGRPARRDRQRPAAARPTTAGSAWPGPAATTSRTSPSSSRWACCAWSPA